MRGARLGAAGADSRAVTFSMAAVARSVVVTKQVLGGKAQDVACRASDGGKQRLCIYMVGVRAKNHSHTHATANQD